MKYINLTDPETKRHKISIRQLKCGETTVRHTFPNGEGYNFVAELDSNIYKEMNEFIKYGYIIKNGNLRG